MDSRLRNQLQLKTVNSEVMPPLQDRCCSVMNPDSSCNELMAELESTDVKINVFAANCIQEVDRFGGGRVMMWRAISITERTNFTATCPSIKAAKWGQIPT